MFSRCWFSGGGEEFGGGGFVVVYLGILSYESHDVKQLYDEYLLVLDILHSKLSICCFNVRWLMIYFKCLCFWENELAENIQYIIINRTECYFRNVDSWWIWERNVYV